MVASPLARNAARFVRGYYWATPLFLFLDVAYDIDLRIPFLDTVPGGKPAYYALGFGCAALVTARPAWTFIVGYVESTLNIALLIITTWSAYFAMLDSAGSEGALVNPFTPQSVTSLALSAVIFAASYLVQTHAVMTSRAIRV